MKNKKIISLAMAASSVATMAVPAFAAEKSAVQTPAPSGRFGVDHIKSKKVIRVDKENLAETMRDLQAKGKEPKVVYKQKDDNGIFQDVLVQYNYDWVSEGVVHADTMAQWREQYNKAKSFVEYAYSDKAVDASTGAKLYDVKVEEVSYEINLGTPIDNTTNPFDIAGVTRKAKKVTVTETLLKDVNGNGTRDTYTYTFDGLDTTFEGEEVVVQSTADIDLTKLDNAALRNEYKRLASVEYNLKQAKKANPGLIVTTEKRAENYSGSRSGFKYTVRIFKKDGVTKVGEFVVYTLNQLDNSLVVKQPGVNNDFAGHWAEQTIVNAMLNGVVSTSSTYRPKETITRAEFASVIYNTLKLQGKILSNGGVSHHAQGNTNQNIHFSDVSEGSWYATPIMELAKAGYLNGNPDGTFRPNNPISREEAARIMSDIIFKYGKETTKTDTNGKKLNVDIVTSFKDDSTIAPWSDESVQALVGKTVNGTVINTKVTGSVIQGDAGKNTFRGKDSISRAEALIMAERAYLAGFQITN